MKRRTFTLSVAVLSATALLGTACGGGDDGGGDGGLTKLTVVLAHTNIAAAEEVSSFAVPKQLGYFEAEGLDVELITAEGSTAALTALASGSAQVAFASSVNIMQAVEKGLPVKAYSGYTTTWPWNIGVKPDSPIRSVADLKGKALGIPSLASVGASDAKVAILDAGLSLDDVELIPVSTGAAAAAALDSGKVAALDDFNDSWQNRKNSGYQVRFLPRSSITEKLFSVSLASTTRNLEQRAGDLEKFARAAFKGLLYSASHPEEAVRLGFKEYPNLRQADADETAAVQKNLATLKSSFQSSTPLTGTPAAWTDWGRLSDERWAAVQEFAVKAQLVKAQLPLDKIWDPKLLDGLNKWDRKPVLDAT